jgi:hypothetical protein
MPMREALKPGLFDNQVDAGVLFTNRSQSECRKMQVLRLRTVLKRPLSKSQCGQAEAPQDWPSSFIKAIPIALTSRPPRQNRE